MTPLNSFRRKAFSAVEVAIVTLILAAAIFPMYMLFRKTGETSFRSSIAYKAIHVAREELEEIRSMPIFPQPGVAEQDLYKGHDWEPVKGKNLFLRSLSGEAPAEGLEAEDFVYPESYRGIETFVRVIAPAIDPDSADRENTRIVRLEVRWKMRGKASNKGARGTQVYHAVVVRRGGA
jgi:hypothetical protein